MKKTILTVMLSALAVSASAVIRPASMITDNMVLEQNANARIWGTADPGEKVTVTTSWDGKSYTTQTDRTGDWCLAVATPAGSFTPYTITIADGSEIKINNVLIGEVWLASGQSNMQMPLKGFDGCCVDGGYAEIASARNWADKVRFFTVPLTQSYEPLDTVDARWVTPSPETAPEFSAVAWHFAKQMSEVLNVPVGIVSAAYGGARVESWTPRDMLEKYPDVSLDKKDIEGMTHYLRPLLMYNAMFNPVSNYTYKGIIWYQGCSNVGAADTYTDRLAAMITRWRSDIGIGDIPFYAVEIAPFQYGDGQTEQAPYLREAQWKAVSMVPNADMISINDLVKPYERYNIHPGNKEAVGRRLCDLALNKTYGCKQFLAGSPRYKSHRIEGGKVYVAIDSPNQGICRNYDIRGFEVAGPDKVFHPAVNPTLRWQTNEIVVESPEVPNPVAVRYCFRDFLPGTLHGGNFLPLIPFRTDNW